MDTSEHRYYRLYFYLFGYRSDLTTRGFVVPPNVNNVVALLGNYAASIGIQLSKCLDNLFIPSSSLIARPKRWNIQSVLKCSKLSINAAKYSRTTRISIWSHFFPRALYRYSISIVSV